MLTTSKYSTEIILWQSQATVPKPFPDKGTVFFLLLQIFRRKSVVWTVHWCQHSSRIFIVGSQWRNDDEHSVNCLETATYCLCKTLYGQLCKIECWFEIICYLTHLWFFNIMMKDKNLIVFCWCGHKRARRNLSVNCDRIVTPKIFKLLIDHSNRRSRFTILWKNNVFWIWKDLKTGAPLSLSNSLHIRFVMVQTCGRKATNKLVTL